MRSQTTFILLTAVTLILGIASASFTAPRIIYVDDDAFGANTGSSWANAYRYLQDALADANATHEPVEIRVAQGVYKPDQGEGQTPGERKARFRLLPDLILRGGYAGVGAQDPNARDSKAYQTILSGKLTAATIPAPHTPGRRKDPGAESYSCCIMAAEKTGPQTRIEGLVLTRACEPWDANHPCMGSALYIGPDASITVSDCTFTANHGSGINCWRSDPNIIDCVFANNVTVADGGGICIGQGNPRIVRCVFANNWAFEGGGFFIQSGSFSIDDCTFTRNTAAGLNWADTGYGGAIRSWSGLDATITNCRFIENLASGGGAAHFGHIGSVLPMGRSGSVRLTGCTFVGNLAGSAGAVEASASYVEARDCVFRQNAALGWGGVMVIGLSEVSLSNCLFAGNRASVAGCLHAYGWRGSVIRGREYKLNVDLQLTNCTLAGNLAPDGWAITCRSYDSQDSDNMCLSNCILDNGSAEISNIDGAQVVVSYTNLRGARAAVYDPCQAVVWGQGNIDVDPCFADAGRWDPNGTPDDPNDDFWVDGDYHLKSQAGRCDAAGKEWVLDDVTSLCIDAGDPNSPLADEPQPNGGRINLGVYGGTAEASKSP
jgi:hypothetical protein